MEIDHNIYFYGHSPPYADSKRAVDSYRWLSFESPCLNVLQVRTICFSLHLYEIKYIKLLAKICITKTYLYIFDPLKPHFCIVKLGFTGVYIIFLISAQKHRLSVKMVLTSTHNLCFVEAVLTSTHNLCFEQKHEKISDIFYLNFFIFWW